VVGGEKKCADIFKKKRKQEKGGTVDGEKESALFFPRERGGGSKILLPGKEEGTRKHTRNGRFRKEAILIFARMGKCLFLRRKSWVTFEAAPKRQAVFLFWQGQMTELKKKKNHGQKK